MNRKGFTLVELLAVIVILSVVLLMGSSSLTAVRRGINENIFESKLQFVISAGKSYGERNKEQFIDLNGLASKTITKTVGELIESNDLETEEYEDSSLVTTCLKPSVNEETGAQTCAVITNPVDDKIINDLAITIYMEHNRVYACIPLTANNRAILDENSCVKTGCTGDICEWQDCAYSDLNYYCTNS